ncbi:MAG: ABC transporter permease [Acidimicrobiales bacterium]
MSKRREPDWVNIGISIASPIVALLIAMGITSILMLISGLHPSDAFVTIGRRVQESTAWIDATQQAIPLYISAIAVAIGFKMNLFNIGVEGQYRVAMLSTVAIGGAVHLPAPLHVTFCIAVAMITGSLWSLIPAVLKVYRGVSEVISTIMLNYIATGLLAFLFSEVFAERKPGDLNPKSRILPTSAWMPNLIEDNLHNVGGFIFVAALLGAVFYLVVWKTRFGFELRASGANPTAARTAGINPKTMILRAMLLSGAVAGMVGMPQLLGDKHAYSSDLQLGLGFSGIAVALLGRNSPVGIAVAAMTFGFLDSAARFLDLESIPKEIVTIMQGVLVLTVVIVYEIARRTKERRTQERASRALDAALATAADTAGAVA